MTEKRMAPGKTTTPYDIRERTFQFSVRLLKWAKTLPPDLGTQIAARQMLESGTAVGAHIEEADGADTPKDRIDQWTVSRQAARATHYWIRLIRLTGAESPEARALEQESTELVNILSALIAKGKRAVDKA